MPFAVKNSETQYATIFDTMRSKAHDNQKIKPLEKTVIFKQLTQERLFRMNSFYILIPVSVRYLGCIFVILFYETIVGAMRRPSFIETLYKRKRPNGIVQDRSAIALLVQTNIQLNGNISNSFTETVNFRINTNHFQTCFYQHQAKTYTLSRRMQKIIFT